MAMSGREFYELGNQYLVQHKTAEALAAFEHAARLEPRQSAIPANKGVVLSEMGKIEEARSAYDDAIQLEKGFYAPYEIRKALLQPVILDSAQVAIDERRKLTKALKKLSATKFLLRNPHDEIGNPGFFLAYQGFDNRDIQVDIATLLAKACSRLRYQANFSARAKHEKIRVGFFSSHFYEHTVGRVNLGLIKHLPRDRFEVLIIRPNGRTDEVTREIQSTSDGAIVVSPILEQARIDIESAELDILLFTDIGMEALSYYLAFSRLAPVQAALWGHPDTTGISNVDYYVSTRPFEPPNAQQFYSEQLILLPRHYICLEKPKEPTPQLEASAFGIENGHKAYLCPQSLFKLHPDTDFLLNEILTLDPKGVICIPRGPEPYWIERLQRRLAKSCQNTLDRIRFIPRIPPHQFRQFLASADAILDPRHFTGGYTSYLAFSTSSPIVTLPGSFLRGRMTSGLYKQMGLEDLIPAEEKGYAGTAVRLANDLDFRKSVSKRIEDASNSIFDDRESVQHFGDFLVEAHEAAKKGSKLNSSSGTSYV